MLDYVALGALLLAAAAVAATIRLTSAQNTKWISDKGQPHIENSNIHVPSDLLVFREMCKERHQRVSENRQALLDLTKTVSDISTKVTEIHAKLNARED